MYKYKKFTINIVTFIFIIFTIIEFIFYLKSDSNLFGLIYLIISLLIIFLLVPCAYNYKRYYSLARISKLIIVIILGIFNSFILSKILLSNMNYIDSSNSFINSIKIIKLYLKPLLYVILILLTFLEFKGEEVIKTISNKNID